MRGFLKWFALVVVLAYAQLFTLVWLNAYTFGCAATIYLNEWGEATAEGVVLFAVFWPVVSVELYFLAVDGGVIGGECRAGRSIGLAVASEPTLRATGRGGRPRRC